MILLSKHDRTRPAGSPTHHDGNYAISTPGLSPVGGKTITATFDGGKLSSNGGVLILREIERKLGLAAVLSRHIPDDRDRMRITHSYSDMTRARMFAIASGHEDCDDLDVLRSDPALKMACGRLPVSGPEPDVATDALAPGERPVLAATCAHGA